MAEPKTKPTDQLLEQYIHLSRATDHDVVKVSLDADVSMAMRKYEVSGIDLAPRDAAEKLRTEFERRHDETITSELLAHLADVEARERELDGLIEASRRAPTPKVGVEATMSELLWRERLRGLTLSEALAAYETAADDAVLQHLVETSPDLKRTLRLSDDPGEREGLPADVVAQQRLSAAIRSRQDARQQASLVAERQALAEARRRNLTVEHLMRQARAGRTIEVARLRPSHASGGHLRQP
jgi:hypothetical protein